MFLLFLWKVYRIVERTVSLDSDDCPRPFNNGAVVSVDGRREVLIPEQKHLTERDFDSIFCKHTSVEEMRNSRERRGIEKPKDREEQTREA